MSKWISWKCEADRRDRPVEELEVKAVVAERQPGLLVAHEIGGRRRPIGRRARGSCPPSAGTARPNPAAPTTAPPIDNADRRVMPATLPAVQGLTPRRHQSVDHRRPASVLGRRPPSPPAHVKAHRACASFLSPRGPAVIPLDPRALASDQQHLSGTLRAGVKQGCPYYTRIRSIVVRRRVTRMLPPRALLDRSSRWRVLARICVKPASRGLVSAPRRSAGSARPCRCLR